MIPSEANGSNGKKTFVQTQLGQAIKQTKQEPSSILDIYWQFLRRKYRSDHTRKNNMKFIKLFLKWIAETKAKTTEELTSDDTQDYKAFCLETYKINGNVGRLNAINNFVDDFLKKPELRITAPRSVKSINKFSVKTNLICIKIVLKHHWKNSLLSIKSMDCFDQENFTNSEYHSTTSTTKYSILMTQKPATTA